VGGGEAWLLTDGEYVELSELGESGEEKATGRADVAALDSHG